MAALPARDCRHCRKADLGYALRSSDVSDRVACDRPRPTWGDNIRQDLRPRRDSRNALPARERGHSASRQQAHVAVERDVAVDNRAGDGETASSRPAVAHRDLDGREARIVMTGSRARPHAPQLHHGLSPFGLSDPDPDSALPGLARFDRGSSTGGPTWGRPCQDLRGSIAARRQPVPRGADRARRDDGRDYRLVSRNAARISRSNELSPGRSFAAFSTTARASWFVKPICASARATSVFITIHP